MSGHDGRIYETEIQCDVCFAWFSVTFADPSKSFEGTCPECDTHYPELYV